VQEIVEKRWQGSCQTIRKGWTSRNFSDCLCVGAIIGVLFVRFFKTIVWHEPISKIFLTAHWDSLFYELRTGQSFSIDGSLVQIDLPYRFFIASCWHHGIPLWNGLSGLGMPLLADPQAAVLSPLFGPFYLAPSIITWNLVLILELVLAAICSYFLCREFECSNLVAVGGALVFVFCPFVQWQLELLGSGICLIPLVFLAFVRAAKKQSLWRGVLAGLTTGGDIICAHPEIAFATVVFATVLLCTIAALAPPGQIKPVLILKQIAVIAIVAFGISAPQLIPFVEYLVNGQTYKLTSAAPADISLHALLANCLFPLHPQGGPFLGPISWLGVAIALCFSARMNAHSRGLLLCLAMSVLAVTKLFPASVLASIPPFSQVQALYFVPEYLLIASIVSAVGINYLLFSHTGGSRGEKIVVCMLGLVLPFLSLVLCAWHHNSSALRFYQTAEICGVNWRAWFFSAACGVAMLLVWATTANRAFRLRILGSLVFICLGVGSLISASYSSLPLRPRFQYPNLPLVVTPGQAETRNLAIGNHLFKPNINLVYGVASLRVRNPLLPKRFVSLLQACGAVTDEFSQYLSAGISPLIDATGTHTIISEQPLLDQTAIGVQPSSVASVRDLAQYSRGLTFRRVRILRDQKEGTIFCCIDATNQPHQGGGYSLLLVVQDPKGSPISFTEPQLIANSSGDQTIVCSAFLPTNVKDWRMSVRVISDIDGAVIRPLRVPFGQVCSDGSWELATSDRRGRVVDIHSDRFKIKAHYRSILAYENKTALDRFFLVGQIQWVNQSEAALNFMKLHASDLRNVAVLEDDQRAKFEKCLSEMELSNDQSQPNFDKSGTIREMPVAQQRYRLTSSSGPELQVQSKRPAVIVVSDLYYPGWKVYLDGHEWPMFRADYLFRAVLVPPGVHQVRFIYQPISFVVGLTIFGLTITVLLCLGLKDLASNKFGVKSVQGI
jgi:hypothetical protein